MTIIDYFIDEKTTDTTIKRRSDIFDPADGRVTGSESTIATIKSIFYVGGQAESLVAEKIRPNVDAVAIVDPDSDVAEKDVLEINGKRYGVIYVDDVGLQSEAYVLALQEKN